jgi:hypothetical protein
MERQTTLNDILYQIVKYPICQDSNYNKTLYHTFMGSKIMAFTEMLMFTYDTPAFVKNLNEFFKFLIQYTTVIEEFPTFTPVIVTSIKYIRTNPIDYHEQTDGFQLTRKLLDICPRLSAAA